MDWSLFAILQMFVIATAVSVAFWLRNNQLSKQNRLLREKLQGRPGSDTTDGEEAGSTAEESAEKSAEDGAVEGTGENTGEQWLADKLAEINDDNPNAPLLRLVLEHQLNAKEDFEQLLQQAAGECGLGGNSSESDNNQQITDLEQALAAAQDELKSMQESQAPASESQSEELKSLLQQYTQDSREMMLCIQTLEKENAALKNQLEDNNAASTETDPQPDTDPAQAMANEPPMEQADQSDPAEQAEPEQQADKTTVESAA